MRVAFDEQIFLLQQQGGVSRYFVELLRHLPTLDPPVEVETPFRRVVNRHALEAFGGTRFAPARGALQPYPQLAVAAARPRRRDRVDVIHHTFYHPRFLRDYAGIPKVVTIHDMIPELLGARGRFGGNPHMALRGYAQRAALLIFVSASAESDFLELAGEPPARRVVIHHGVDDRFLAGGPRPTGFPRDYLLFVGNRRGYKDFETALTAFRHLDPQSVCDLVCVGGGPLDTAELASAASVGLAGRLHQFSLSDTEMPGAYANARAFIFPSRYEGFGLPVLEAMAAGSPVILARTSSLPEVGGEAALYFTPGDAEELAAVLSDLLLDSSTHADLVLRGRARAREFTWSRTAQQTAAAYHLVAG